MCGQAEAPLLCHQVLRILGQFQEPEGMSAEDSLKHWSPWLEPLTFISGPWAKGRGAGKAQEGQGGEREQGGRGGGGGGARGRGTNAAGVWACIGIHIKIITFTVAATLCWSPLHLSLAPGLGGEGHGQGARRARGKGSKGGGVVEGNEGRGGGLGIHWNPLKSLHSSRRSPLLEPLTFISGPWAKGEGRGQGRRLGHALESIKGLGLRAV